MRQITVFLLVGLAAVVMGCGGGTTTTTTLPTTTATTLAPTTTVPASSADVAQARTKLETDLVAFKASLEGLRALSKTSTKSDFTSARDTIESSWNAVIQSAAALKTARGSQAQSAQDQLQVSMDAVQKAWDDLATLVEEVQSGTITVSEAVAQVPGKLAALAVALPRLSEAVKAG